jgi:hypothetical protein
MSFPKDFKRIKGENLTSIDDVYRVSVAYQDYKTNNEKFKKYVSEDFGFPFYQTKDSLLWGTGKVGHVYSYIVVDWGGQAFELFSNFNDNGFSHYSRWLLSTIRKHHKNGKLIMFQMQ